jgi:transcriptional regulator with XRE-family HTH domain
MPTTTSPAPLAMSPLSVAIRKRFDTFDAFAEAMGVSRSLVSMVLTGQRQPSRALRAKALAAGFTDAELSTAPITDPGQYVEASVAIALATSTRELGLPPEVAESALALWKRGELEGTVATNLGRDAARGEQLASAEGSSPDQMAS